MWIVVEFSVMGIITLVAITEFFYPLIVGKPLFGSFRKNVSAAKSAAEQASLDVKIDAAKEKIREVKDIQHEVDKNFNTAAQLKEQADDLLKN